MSDFSLFSLFTAGLACMVPFVSAYTKPVGPNPSGNPISQPGLNSLVPAGKGFEVTWQPTTKGSVTLVLLKGPATDAQPLGVIAEGIPNNGMYVWVPSTDLEPSANNQPEGYGIQLIVDATGQYQYTMQFGISNPSWHAGESWGNLGGASSTATSSATSNAQQHSTVTSAHTTGANTPTPYGGSSTTTTTTSSLTKSTNGTVTSTATHTASSGWPQNNTTVVSPTKPMTVPSTLRTTSTPVTIISTSTGGWSTPTTTPTPTSSPVPTTNGASSFAASSFVGFVGFVVAAGVAAFAL